MLGDNRPATGWSGTPPQRLPEKQSPAQLDRPLQLWLEEVGGSVLKVLQKEEGHGSPWGVLVNPDKRKAEP